MGHSRPLGVFKRQRERYGETEKNVERKRKRKGWQREREKGELERERENRLDRKKRWGDKKTCKDRGRERSKIQR